MSKQLEKPFEYLRRRDGSEFSRDIIDNWYRARAYVLDKLKDVVIGPESGECLHVTVLGDSPLMLSLVRQLALSAHFVNFDDTKKNCTVITIVSKDRNIVEELKKEEYLCYLPDICKYSLHGADPVNNDSYVDIELRIVEEGKGDDGAVMMSEDDVEAFLKTKSDDEVYSIDTRKAVLANRIYSLGTLIDNLPAEDIHCASRYALALDVFQNDLMRIPIAPLVNKEKWETDLIRVKNGLSNIFCTDCFESRALGMKNARAWEEYNEALSKSEHARWATEKLVMGFRPFSEQERIHDEELFGAEKARYRNRLKKNPKDLAHVDLCSFSDLRRITPSDLKYDSFLMLAIPRILKKL